MLLPVITRYIAGCRWARCLHGLPEGNSAPCCHTEGTHELMCSGSYWPLCLFECCWNKLGQRFFSSSGCSWLPGRSSGSSGCSGSSSAATAHCVAASGVRPSAGGWRPASTASPQPPVLRVPNTPKVVDLRLQTGLKTTDKPLGWVFLRVFCVEGVYFGGSAPEGDFPPAAPRRPGLIRGRFSVEARIKRLLWPFIKRRPDGSLRAAALRSLLSASRLC